MKILVVDDSKVNRVFIEKILVKYGHEVETASNGMEALQKVGKLMPDLIILDIMMPEMDGYETCSFLTNNPDTQDIPIIVLTSLDKVKDLVKAFDCGAMDFINKPPNEMELIARINSALKIKDYQDKLKEMIITDGLTGLYTHSYFIATLEKHFYSEMRYGEGLGVLLMDVDDFKKINDTYGHIAGDKVLVMLSNLIEESIRKSDIAARYGGEEFAIIFPHSNIQELEKLAERLRAQIEKAVIQERNNQIGFTVSMGLTIFRKTDKNYIDLIRRADDSLYIAKKTGKNRVLTNF